MEAKHPSLDLFFAVFCGFLRLFAAMNLERLFGLEASSHHR